MKILTFECENKSRKIRYFCRKVATKTEDAEDVPLACKEQLHVCEVVLSLIPNPNTPRYRCIPVYP